MAPCKPIAVIDISVMPSYKASLSPPSDKQGQLIVPSRLHPDHIILTAMEKTRLHPVVYGFHRDLLQVPIPVLFNPGAARGPALVIVPI